MLKRLGWREWVIIGAAIGFSIAAILFVAHKQHRATQEYKAHREEYCSSLGSNTPDQTKECREEGNSASDYLPWGYNLISWPEGITTWAIIFTGFFIALQALETHKAAEATRDSIRLQEAGMRQWVNIVPIRISRCVRPDRPGLCEVSLLFEIINKTDYLMTILRIETNVGANVHEFTKSVVDCNQPLVPQKSDGDSSHPFYAKTLVDAGIWNEKGRIFVVTGTITYLDCMEISRTQTFEDLYLGIDDGELRRMKPSGIGNIVEEQQPESQPQNPN
jgi:hypothetical protein